MSNIRFLDVRKLAEFCVTIPAFEGYGVNYIVGTLKYLFTSVFGVTAYGVADTSEVVTSSQYALASKKAALKLGLILKPDDYERDKKDIDCNILKVLEILYTLNQFDYPDGQLGKDCSNLTIQIVDSRIKSPTSLSAIHFNLAKHNGLELTKYGFLSGYVKQDRYSTFSLSKDKIENSDGIVNGIEYKFSDVPFTGTTEDVKTPNKPKRKGLASNTVYSDLFREALSSGKLLCTNYFNLYKLMTMCRTWFDINGLRDYFVAKEGYCKENKLGGMWIVPRPSCTKDRKVVAVTIPDYVPPIKGRLSVRSKYSTVKQKTERFVDIEEKPEYTEYEINQRHLARLARIRKTQGD